MEQKILVVEDDPVFRNYLYQVLKYDFEVFTAEGPLEALDILSDEAFSLMITDLRMPDMDGRDLVKKVHAELDPNIIVIVITAFEDDWPVDEATSTNVFRYLRKGAFLPTELKQNVEKALEVRGSIVSLEEYKRRVDMSETIYKDVFEKSTDALFVADVKLKPVTINHRFEQISGYKLGDISQGTLFDIISPEHRQDAIQAFDAQIAGQPPGSISVDLVSKDGSKRHVKVWARLVQDIQGMSKAVFGIVRDMSRVKKDVCDVPEKSDAKTENDRVSAVEKKFQRLTEHAKDIIIWLDSDYKCEYVNSEVERSLGYTSDELLDKKIPWKEMLHSEDYPLVEKWIGSASQGITDLEGEFRAFTKSKYMLFLSYRISILYAPDKTFAGMDIVAEDITQQKIAEQELRKANKKILEFNERLTNGVGKKIRALRESEERYKHIVEDSNDVIFSLDKEARIVYMNRRGLQILGMKSADVYGRPYNEFVVDDPSDKKLKEIIGALVDNTDHEPFDMSIETSAGKRIYRTAIIRIGSKKKHEFVCVARDLSEEIAKNKRLKLLANIEYHSADAIIGLDTARNIMSWNQGAYMMFGWKEEEVLGKSAFIIVPNEEIKDAGEILDEVKVKGLVKDRETRRKTKDGQILDVALTITTIKDTAGEILGFSAIIKDLSEQKKMETALIQSERLAATGKLSASIAHEINNPLYGIRSCLNHVLNTKNNGVDRQFVRLAVKETDRIADLIRNMKTFYLPNEGKGQEIDVNETLREVFMFNRKYLEENMVKLDFRPVDIPKIECVPEQIKQVFLNIITNAVEAMPEGGDLSIDTTSDEGGQSINVAFKDTGVGIASNDIPQIFDMFYSKKPMVKGVGLGLSVSYGIIKRHGGSIDVDSEEGSGTTFTVRLPLKTLIARQMRLDLK